MRATVSFTLNPKWSSMKLISSCVVNIVDGKSAGLSGPPAAHLLAGFNRHVPTVSQFFLPGINASEKIILFCDMSAATNTAKAQMSARENPRRVSSKSFTIGARASNEGRSPAFS